VQDTNHVVSKKIVELPFDVFALEYLESAKMRKKDGGRFNTILGSCLPFQLGQFIEYTTDDRNKSIIYVDPNTHHRDVPTVVTSIFQLPNSETRKVVR
jgi:hypothetical protein